MGLYDKNIHETKKLEGVLYALDHTSSQKDQKLCHVQAVFVFYIARYVPKTASESKILQSSLGRNTSSKGEKISQDVL